MSKRETIHDVFLEEARRKGQSESPKSEEELEEIRRFKMQELYRKIGYIRFYMFCVFVAGGMAIYTYVIKNKRKNIIGS